MSYSGDILAQSPDLYLRLGEASGTTMSDSSGNSHNGTYTGTITFSVTGAISGDSDTAISLPGDTANYGSVAGSSWMDRSTFTAICWFKTTDTGINYLFTRWGATAGTNVWAIDLQSSDVIRGYARIGGATRTLNPTVTGLRDGNWHMVAITYDNAAFRILVDGVSKSSLSITSALNTAATEAIVVGKRTNASSSADGLNGSIDECYFGPALSDATVAALYSTGHPSVSAVTATATATAVAPTLSAGASVTGVAATATATAIAPSLAVGNTVSPPVSTATADALAPTVTADATVNPPAATATAQAEPPVIVVPGDQTVDAVAATATADAIAPTLTWDNSPIAVAATATADALPPTVAADATVLAALATATAEALAPFIFTGSPDATVDVPCALAAATAPAPTVAAIYRADTDTSNLLDGRDRRGGGTAVVTVPVIAPPNTLTLTTKVDKAMALPTPTMVNGRPT